MSTPILPKEPNGVNAEPGPKPELLDYDDPDAEGLEPIEGELHAFSCPCVSCAAENARQDALWALYHQPHEKGCECFNCDDAEAAVWLKANGLRLDDEWAEQEGLRQLKAALKKCKTCSEEYMLTVNTRPDGRCFDCQNRPMGYDRITEDANLNGKRIRGVVVERNAKGLAEALERLDVELRYNKREHRAEMEYNALGWQPFNDRSVAKLRETLMECFVYLGPPGKDGSPGEPRALKFGREAWADVVNVLLFDSEVDPFMEWLDGLPKWDETERLDKWLPEVFTITERLPLAEWAGRFMVLGAVWRAFHPGLKLDEFPILIGKGGLGKSTAARFLLPADRDEWFSDGLNLAADSKVRAESLQGRVICEVAEMQGSTRADLESLKAFLSRTDDGAVRLAYRKDPELLLRRCIIIGTADRKEPLPNDQNLRRFVPVYLDAGQPARIREYLDGNRKQLWAEALHLYGQGIEARLPDDLKGLQSEATDRARSRDTVIEDAVAAWTWGNDGFTMAEIAAGVHLIDSNDKGAKLRMADQHRLGQVLESQGYAKQRERRGGVQATRWYRGDE